MILSLVNVCLRKQLNLMGNNPLAKRKFKAELLLERPHDKYFPFGIPAINPHPKVLSKDNKIKRLAIIVTLIT